MYFSIESNFIYMYVTPGSGDQKYILIITILTHKGTKYSAKNMHYSNTGNGVVPGQKKKKKKKKNKERNQ